MGVNVNVRANKKNWSKSKKVLTKSELSVKIIISDKNSEIGGVKKMKQIIEILMKRDGLTAKEAEQEYLQIRESIQEALEYGGYDEVEEILMYDAGLEMDYIHCFI